MIPVFEIIPLGLNPTMPVLRIYADGVVTGMAGDYLVKNLLPLMIRPEAEQFVREECTYRDNSKYSISAADPTTTCKPRNDNGDEDGLNSPICKNNSLAAAGEK